MTSAKLNEDKGMNFLTLGDTKLLHNWQNHPSLRHVAIQGTVHQKLKFCNHSLSLNVFQICINFVEKDFRTNACKQTVIGHH